MEKEFIAPYPYKCEKCGGLYGRTNMKYEGVEIWQACYCQPDNLIYGINTNNIIMDEPEKKENEAI